MLLVLPIVGSLGGVALMSWCALWACMLVALVRLRPPPLRRQPRPNDTTRCRRITGREAILHRLVMPVVVVASCCHHALLRRSARSSCALVMPERPTILRFAASR